MTDQEQLYAVVDALIDMGAVAAKVVKDGSVTVSDIPALTGLLPELLTALPDIKVVPAAVESMAAADAEALVAHIVTKLSLSTKKAQDIANAALSVASGLVALYGAIKE